MRKVNTPYITKNIEICYSWKILEVYDILNKIILKTKTYFDMYNRRRHNQNNTSEKANLREVL